MAFRHIAKRKTQNIVILFALNTQRSFNCRCAVLKRKFPDRKHSAKRAVFHQGPLVGAGSNISVFAVFLLVGLCRTRRSRICEAMPWHVLVTLECLRQKVRARRHWPCGGKMIQWSEAWRIDAKAKGTEVGVRSLVWVSTKEFSWFSRNQAQLTTLLLAFASDGGDFPSHLGAQ